MANRLLLSKHSSGRILDLGCGAQPLFLAQVPFGEKFGIDQLVQDEQVEEWAKKGLHLQQQNLNQMPWLPFPSSHFDSVTMLAVFEHIEAANLVLLIREIRRVLRPGGVYVLTTPAQWTDPILSFFSKVGLLSAEEVEDHEKTHTHQSIAEILIEGGFTRNDIMTGRFELGMNLWAKAVQSKNP